MYATLEAYTPSNLFVCVIVAHNITVSCTLTNIEKQAQKLARRGMCGTCQLRHVDQLRASVCTSFGHWRDYHMVAGAWGSGGGGSMTPLLLRCRDKRPVSLGAIGHNISLAKSCLQLLGT